MEALVVLNDAIYRAAGAFDVPEVDRLLDLGAQVITTRYWAGQII